MTWFSRDEDRYRRRDDISSSEVARSLEAHVIQCRIDKEEFSSKLDEHAEDSNRKHLENLAKFEKINRTIYIAMGIGTSVVWFLSHVVGPR